MGYLIRLEVFEGPFDLLLELIDRSEIDIWDIPIATIAQQYLDYLKQMQEMDLVISGDFLVMAATLLEIKTKMLIPSDPHPETGEIEEEEDPREELIQRLLEYKFYKQAAHFLAEHGELASGMYPKGYRPNQEKKTPLFTNPIGQVSLEQLTNYYHQVIEVAEENRKVREIKRHVSLSERVGQVRLSLARQKKLAFSDLLDGEDRIGIVVTFLAVLELIRMKELIAYQRESFGEIFLRLKDVSEQEEVI